jgi:hypothetical protein
MIIGAEDNVPRLERETITKKFKVKEHNYKVVFVPDVPHHDVDEGVLDEAEEHEDGARGHEHVYSLHQDS